MEMSFVRPQDGEEPRRKAQVSKRILDKYLTRFALSETPLDERLSGFLSTLNFGVTLPAKVAQAAVSAVRESLPEKNQARETPEIKLAGPQEPQGKVITQKEGTIIPLAGNVNFTEQEVITLPSPTFRPTYLAGVGVVRQRKLSQRPDLTTGMVSVRGERRFELSEALATRLGIASQPRVLDLTVPKVETVAPPPPQPPIEEKIAELPIEEKPVPKVTPQKKAASKTPRMTNVPNVLQGLVHDEEGHLLEGTIIVVKNESGVPVRALKTNKLGQYIISTPLSSGHYTIEAEKEEHNFDILAFEAKGEIIEPIEIIGKKAPYNAAI